MGRRTLNQTALGVLSVLEVKILPRRNLGVECPSITGKLLPLNPVCLLGTAPSFDETRMHSAEASLQLVKMGEISMSFNLMITEQRMA